MMEEMTVNKRRSRAYGLLIFASIFMYIAITTAKNLYTAEKTTLYSLGIFGNLTSLASTMEYYFYTYAVMQIALIFFVKRINIKWFLTATLSVSSVLTLLLPFTDGITQHYILFGINGVLQAGIWGCLLKMLSVHLPARLLPVANQIMSAGPAVAGAMAYGIAALCGENWKTPFILMGVISLISVLTYCLAVTCVERFPKEVEMHHVVLSDGTEADVEEEEDNDFIGLNNKKRIAVFFIASTLMGFLFTSLYFMVNNNLDMYLKEIGGFSNSVAKMLTIFAPVCAVIGPLMSVRSCERHKNFIAVAAFYFGVAILSVLVMLFVFDKSVPVSLALLVLFLVFVNGGRSVTLSIASLKMRKKIDTGVYSTAVNAVSSLASGISPKFIAMILDNGSYSSVQSWRLSFTLVFAFIFTAVMLLCVFIILVKCLNKKDRMKEAMQEKKFA